MRIKLDELKNIVFLNCKEKTFTGYTTEFSECEDGHYREVLVKEEKYIHLCEIDNIAYISERHLLETLLTEEIAIIYDNSIYEYQYMESQLIPSNYNTESQKGFLDSVTEDISGKIRKILVRWIQY